MEIDEIALSSCSYHRTTFEFGSRSRSKTRSENNPHAIASVPIISSTQTPVPMTYRIQIPISPLSAHKGITKEIAKSAYSYNERREMISVYRREKFESKRKKKEKTTNNSVL